MKAYLKKLIQYWLVILRLLPEPSRQPEAEPEVWEEWPSEDGFSCPHCGQDFRIVYYKVDDHD